MGMGQTIFKQSYSIIVPVLVKPVMMTAKILKLKSQEKMIPGGEEPKECIIF